MNEYVFKILIVDDEKEARSLLSSLLSEINNVKVVGEADNVERALYLLVEHYPNLILLDINMPGKTGMDLLKLIRKRNFDVPVVFISAYEEFAIDAIRNGVYDFLLKPVNVKNLTDIIDKYKRLNKKDLPSKLMEILNNIKEKTKIQIKSNHSYILVNPSDIVYCATMNRYTHIFLSNGKTEISNTPLVSIEDKVKMHNFFRLGRSYLINQDYIRRINKSTNTCTLKVSDMTWEISASHNSIKELLLNNYNYA